VTGGDLWGLTRGKPPVAFARQVAMYLTRVSCGLSFTEIGHVFARDRTTVAHACELVEERREDPILDSALDHLERAFRLLMFPALPSAAHRR
jgi:chromosomal replication initiation ATPase DnaA